MQAHDLAGRRGEERVRYLLHLQPQVGGGRTKIRWRTGRARRPRPQEGMHRNSGFLLQGIGGAAEGL